MLQSYLHCPALLHIFVSFCFIASCLHCPAWWSFPTSHLISSLYMSAISNKWETRGSCYSRHRLSLGSLSPVKRIKSQRAKANLATMVWLYYAVITLAWQQRQREQWWQQLRRRIRWSRVRRCHVHSATSTSRCHAPRPRACRPCQRSTSWRRLYVVCSPVQCREDQRLWGTLNYFLRSNDTFSGVLKMQLERINWKNGANLSGLGTQRPYFLKKIWHEMSKFPVLQKLTHMDHMDGMNHMVHIDRNGDRIGMIRSAVTPEEISSGWK